MGRQIRLYAPPNVLLWHKDKFEMKETEHQASEAGRSLCLTPFCLRAGHERESEVAQSCPTLCDPMDCSLPGSSLHGILQARVLEWVAISFSREGGSKVKGKKASIYI